MEATGYVVELGNVETPKDPLFTKGTRYRLPEPTALEPATTTTTTLTVQNISVALMVFAKNTAVAQGFSDNLAETARNIGSAVKNWDVGSSTMINSAIVDAAHYMEKHAGRGGRRAILILTDNLSTSYRLTDGQVIRELDKADTVMNAIITGRAIRPQPLTPGRPANPDFTPANVYDLAEKTGGEWVKAENAGDSFKDMIERIRSRYMLAYHAPDGQPGTFRHITVTLDGSTRKRYPGAELHSRSGYYAE